MQPHVTKRVLDLTPSPTVAVDTKAKELKANGVPILNMGIGEPDFETPLHIKQEAINSLSGGDTKYSSPQGIPALRQAIADKLKKDNHIAYDPSQIVIGTGSKQVLYSIFQTLCNPGDEVIIPTPTWLTFVEQTKLAGGKPVFIKLKPPFKLTAKDVEKAVTNKTKILLLNSPSNPTGAMIDPQELKKIAQLAVKKNLWVIADEIYEKLVYTTKHLSIASLNDEIKNRTVTTNGFAKSYAMTGWRLGYAAGPVEVIKGVSALQSQIIGNVPLFIQKAGVKALTFDQKSVSLMHKEFEKRRNFLTTAFGKIKGLSFTAPEGAFYLFVSIEKILNKKYPTAEKWCAALLEKEHVALVPGEAFLAPGFFRLSFAASMSDLKKAVEKIRLFINAVKE